MHHQSTAAVLFGVVIGCVVRDVAMDHPFARLKSCPDYIVTLTGADIDRVRLKTSRWLERLTVARNHKEGTAVNVHRMNEAVIRTDEANLECFAHLHMNRIR